MDDGISILYSFPDEKIIWLTKTVNMLNPYL